MAEEGEIGEVKRLDTYYTQATPTLRTSSGTIYREAVYTVNSDGSDLKKLEWSTARDSESRTRIGRETRGQSLPEEDVTTSQWSPDGHYIAFVARYYGEPDGLYVANLDTSQVQQILDLSIILAGC